MQHQAGAHQGVVDYYDEDKVLTFSASNQVHDLAEHIGGESYHSNKTKKAERETH